MSKKRSKTTRVAATTRRPTGETLQGAAAVNLLLDPKLDPNGLPPLVVLEQVGRRSVISASGVVILASEDMQVEWVRAVVQRSQRTIPARLLKKAPSALLLPVPGDPTQILYQFVDDRPNTDDFRIKGAIPGHDNRLLVYAKIRRRGIARQFIAQTCLQFEGGEPRKNDIGSETLLKEHTVSIPRGKMNGVVQKYKSSQSGYLDECRGTATIPSAGIREAAAFIFPDQTAANAPGDPPPGATTVQYKSLMAEYKFKLDYYDGVWQDKRVRGVTQGATNFLVVWAKFDGDPNWYRAINTINGLQFEGIT